MTEPTATSPEVRVDIDGQVLVVTVDRPKANAIDAATSKVMYEAFRQLRDDPSLRVGILTGAGDRFFSAGWDLKAAAAGEAPDADYGPGGFAGITEMFDIGKPVIAAVNGSAYGGGVELWLACDLVVCSDQAEFAFTEARLGLVPDAGGLVRLPAAVPRAVALELMLTGRRFDAQEAARLGLVSRVVPHGAVLAEAKALAATLKDWIEPIVRMWRFSRSNGITEGFHTKMEMLSRRAFGFRNFENYRMRVLAQCGWNGIINRVQ